MYVVLRVRISRAPDGAVVGIVASGHTGFDRKGRDIVCAGASAVLHTAVLGVTRVARAAAEVRAGDGRLEVWLDGHAGSRSLAWERAQAVLEAAILGIREIAARYPGHVEVLERQEGSSRGEAPEPARCAARISGLGRDGGQAGVGRIAQR